SLSPHYCGTCSKLHISTADAVYSTGMSRPVITIFATLLLIMYATPGGAIALSLTFVLDELYPCVLNHAVPSGQNMAIKFPWNRTSMREFISCTRVLFAATYDRRPLSRLIPSE